MPSNRPRRPQQEDKPVSKVTKGKLNNIELIGIGLIAFAMILYALSKCGSGKTPTPVEQPTVTEQIIDSTVTNVDSTAPDRGNESSFSSEPNTPTAPLTANPDSMRQARKLYVLADSLRLRQSPELSGKVLSYLRYGEEVTDLGELTALQKLRISADEVRTAPWVKVRTKNGKIGWAFGAYMQFYPIPRTATPPSN